MNEAPLPAQTSLPQSLPPPSLASEAATKATKPSRLRRSLEACTTEGVFAEIVGACFGSAVLAAWSVELGTSPLLLGVLWGLPHFGQVLQLPALWVTAALGRKRAAVVTHALARQVTLPIAFVPFVDISLDAKRATVVGLFALASVLSIIGHNAWLAWMGELVPARIRGAYFGRRSALCSVAATIATLTIAAALDGARLRGSLGSVLAAVIIVRSMSGAWTTVLMLRQHDPPAPATPPRMRDFLEPLADRAFRRLLAHRAAWGIGAGLGASLSAIFMLRSLGLGFMGVATYAASIALLRMITTPLWGRTLDRAGARRVLVVCTLGAALSSFAWVIATPQSSWLIAIDALVSGLLLSGQELAVFMLPLAAHPTRRPLYSATSVMTGGVAFGLASVAAGALVHVVSLRTVLLSAAVWRVLAAVVATGVAAGRTAAVARVARTR